MKLSKEGFLNPMKVNKYSATERQEARKKLIEQLPPKSRSHKSGDWFEHRDYDYDDEEWKGYRPFIEETIGGRFLNVLDKLNIINRKTSDRSWRDCQETHWLYGHVAVAPNGMVYSDAHEKAKFNKIFKKNS